MPTYIPYDISIIFIPIITELIVYQIIVIFEKTTFYFIIKLQRPTNL